jgi:hypothetical protein
MPRGHDGADVEIDELEIDKLGSAGRANRKGYESANGFSKG